MSIPVVRVYKGFLSLLCGVAMVSRVSFKGLDDNFFRLPGMVWISVGFWNKYFENSSCRASIQKVG
jgi:hypothetical protein